MDEKKLREVENLYQDFETSESANNVYVLLNYVLITYLTDVRTYFKVFRGQKLTLRNKFSKIYFILLALLVIDLLLILLSVTDLS